MYEVITTKKAWLIFIITVYYSHSNANVKYVIFRLQVHGTGQKTTLLIEHFGRDVYIVIGIDHKIGIDHNNMESGRFDIDMSNNSQWL